MFTFTISKVPDRRPPELQAGPLQNVSAMKRQASNKAHKHTHASRKHLTSKEV
jgi:hypothetical protein